MNTNRRSKTKRAFLLIIVIAILIAIIGGTYARYSSTANGSGTVNIAKWAVEVNEQDISNATGTFNLTFTANNADTVANKIAPNGTATAYVDIDLSGTEVSVDFTCALADTASTALTSVFGSGYASKVNVTVGTPVLQGTTSNMTLSGTTVTVGSAAMSGVVRVPIELNWTHADANNAADTNTGVTQTSVTIPVTLTVQQHIGS